MVHRAWRVLFAGIVVWCVRAVECPAAAADFEVVVTAETPTPRDGATDVDVQSPVRVHFSQPIDPDTLSSAGMRLLDPSGHIAPALLQTDLTGGVATLTPTHPLKVNTRYELRLTAALRSAEGKGIEPFTLRFTTSSKGPPVDPRFVCRAVKLVDRDHNTCITIGPDGCLYVADAFGTITRYKLDGRGHDAASDIPYHAEDDQIVGMVFDPDAAADRLIMWISYGRYDGEYNGAIARLELPPFKSGGAATKQDYITGLPHDVLLHHQPNGIAFGPDGRLYQSVGGVATLGGSPNWGMHETPLSAAVIVADVRSPRFNGGKLPCNVRTAPPVDYNPSAPDAPVRIFATGFRNAYGVCWHSTGHLFTATNQNSIPNGPKTPANEARGVPAINAMPREMLYRVVEGKYYGHPNPSRGEFVLNGGNPTDGVDPFEVREYPVGVRPEPAFDPSLIYDLRPGGGNSANGMDEYTARGPLQDRLLIAYFSGAKCVQSFAIDKAGRITHEYPLIDEKGGVIRFKGAIDVAAHPRTGRVYIADFGEWKRPNFGHGGAVWMLEPVAANADRKSNATNATPAVVSLRNGSTWGDAAAGFHLTLRKDSLDLQLDGQPIATYSFGDDRIKRPHFAHVKTPGGVQVTRSHPPVASKDPTDHDTMHPGLWLAFGRIGDADGREHDFWRNKARIVHEGFTAAPKVADGRASFETLNRFEAAGGRVICRQHTAYTLRKDPAGWLMTIDARFFADERFHFGVQEEMGLGVRVATPLSVRHGRGAILSSTGGRDEKGTWGKTAAWWDYFGAIDGRHIGVMVMSAPANGDVWSHSRDYGFLTANPFPVDRAQNRDRKTIIKPGDTFRLRFGVLVHGQAAAGFDREAAYGRFIEALGKQ